METILNKDSAKSIWDSMKQKYQGSTKVKRAQLQALRREFELLGMKEESVDEYFSRTLSIVNKMKMHGERMKQVTIVEKILRSMATRFNYVVCSIEESNDVTTLSVDELQSSLMVHEQRMKGQKEEEQALKVTNTSNDGGRGRGRGGARGGRGRGRQPLNKEAIECYHCHKLGHYRYECPNWEDKANFAEYEEEEEEEEEEELLLMARTHEEENSVKKVWFLDSGCSNHMCGHKDWFFDLNEQIRVTVKLGNDSRLITTGKGSVKLEIDGIVQIISDVYYIPDLKSNLLSIGQLQEKGLTVISKGNIWKVYHNERGLILQSKMSSNRMFAVMAKILTVSCFKAST